MKLYFDFEFNSYKGILMSLGIVAEDNSKRYYVFNEYEDTNVTIDPWVSENVLPKINSVQGIPGINEQQDNFVHLKSDWGTIQKDLDSYLTSLAKQDPNLVFICDWPDDARYMCELLITGPGTRIDIPGPVFKIQRVDSFPNGVYDAFQHNALADALALRLKLTGK